MAILIAAGGFAMGGALVLIASMLLRADAVPHLDAIGEPLGPVAAMAGEVPTQAGPIADNAATGELVVDVAGAVLRPGLHRLRDGDRVGDAIAAAGGFGPRVDVAEASRSLNLAQPLVDGVKVFVPELGSEDPRRREDPDSRIDLNRAGREELESLPGIGPVTASKIIEAREEAPFETTRDVRSRGVVGQSVFDDIKELVKVSP